MAAICGALAIACASTSIAMVRSTSMLAAGLFAGHAHTQQQQQQHTRTQPWWTGFEDTAMNSLMAASHSPSESGVAAAYIVVKVKTLELLYLQNMRSAIDRQSALMGDGKRAHDDFARELASRRSRAEDSIGKLKTQRASYLAYLATQCGMSETALTELIADALQDRALPRFAATVPDALPMTILSNRDDVNLAASVYGADPAAMLDGVIDASSETGGVIEAVEAADKPLYAQAVLQAREQVSAALHRLQAQSDIANNAYARVTTAKAAFESSKARHDRSEISEVQLMEDFQGLLLDLQVLAAANGELALAWVVLMDSIGNGTSIDANADPQVAQLPFLHKVSRKLRNP